MGFIVTFLFLLVGSLFLSLRWHMTCSGFNQGITISELAVGKAALLFACWWEVLLLMELIHSDRADWLETGRRTLQQLWGQMEATGHMSGFSVINRQPSVHSPRCNVTGNVFANI